MGKLILGSILFSFLVSACTTRPEEISDSENAFSDTVLQSIYQIADDRKPKQLIPYFDHQTAAYRMAAARCAASMTDSLFIESLSDLLKDPIPYVRLHAAFAVGQYRDEALLPDLEKAIKKSTIPEIKSEVLTAIGKCSNRKATEYLIFHEPNTALEEAGKIWGIYYAMLRGNLEEGDLRVIVAHLESQEQETRLAAANVLARQKDFKLSSFRTEILEALEEEEVGEIRAVLTRSIKGLTDIEEKLLKLAEQDPDSRVRAEAISALPVPYSKDALQAIFQSLEDGSPWVAMAAANALGSISLTADELSSIAFLMTTSPIPEVRSAIASAYLASDKPQKGWNYWNETLGSKTQKAILAEYLPMKPDVVDSLKEYALEDSPLGTACFGKLTTWYQGSDAEPSWMNFVNAAFTRKLLAQSYIAATEMMNSENYVGLDTAAVVEMYRSLTIEGQAETRNAVRVLLQKLRIPIPEITIQGQQSPDWEFIQSIPKSSLLSLYTDKGEISISLLVEDAPVSVANIISHAQKGGYDNTILHRIVPVFVSQGGGPRGDGFGSSEHTIRSEFSNLHFGPGVVGLASAGKDTESCQFFITHLSTPHLNGRYTIIGALNGGMGILEKITSGTRIDSVKVNM